MSYALLTLAPLWLETGSRQQELKEVTNATILTVRRAGTLPNTCSVTAIVTQHAENNCKKPLPKFTALPDGKVETKRLGR